MTKKNNPYEKAARMEKVEKLADWLQANGFSAGLTAQATKLEWAQVASLASVKVPSDETIAAVIAKLQARQQYAAEPKVSAEALFARFGQ